MTDKAKESRCWYVVHSKARKELAAATVLETDLGVTVYLPQVYAHPGGGYAHPGGGYAPRNGGYAPGNGGSGKGQRLAPLFPRYLFVAADLSQTPPSAINGAPGVARLVTFGGGPATVPAAVVASLQAEVAALNAAGGLPAHGFKPGDEVRLKEGPLRGLRGVFLGPTTPSQRVRILLDFLGGESEAEVDVEHLEAARWDAPARRSRRTRGKGRRIKGSQ